MNEVYEFVIENLLGLIILLPLLGAIFLHFFGRFIGEPRSGALATLAIAGSFGLAIVASIPMFAGGELAHHPTTVMLWDWMPSIGAAFELRWDPLAAFMTLIVTGVGMLIHIYSVGYMHGDERFPRFFTYLNLFAASMLTLVLANNFAMLFIGWELVGLCSYLLISFWYTKPSAAAAGKKAFVVNRIGDLGFIVGLMIVFTSFGTLSMGEVLELPGEIITAGTATAICLLFLVGAAGKSAQIPLYVWLPDAMEGPTPVSALIHAATMVTAGVYLIARTAALFQLSGTASVVVATVGAATALVAATIAIGQNDIKKVLAYSTVSQLGYMFLAVGATGYVAGLFHLMTHAFFKALLFLAAGSVIHGMHDQQDMRKMGGLLKKMPVTAWTMGVGTLAIAGLFPLSGFWSKDEVLASAFASGGWFMVLWVVGIVTALITAFYITRQFIMVFLGEPRWEEGVEPHESPRTMTLPLVVLAVLAAVAGFVNMPKINPALEHFLEPSLEGIQMAHLESSALIVLLAAVSGSAGIIGIGLATLVYYRGGAFRQWFLDRTRRPFLAWENAYWVDQMFGRTIVLPGKRAAFLTARFDDAVVDGSVNGVGRLTSRLGTALRPLQTGFVRTYGVTLAAAAVGLAIWLLSRGAL